MEMHMFLVKDVNKLKFTWVRCVIDGHNTFKTHKRQLSKLLLTETLCSVHFISFRVIIAEGMKDFLYMFFQASVTLYQLPDGSTWEEW